MFDPKKAALLIVSKHGEPDGDEEDMGAEDGSMGPEALKAAFESMKKGDYNAAYDAFRAAVHSCGSDEYEE
jgi:TolA-binding protein